MRSIASARVSATAVGNNEVISTSEEFLPATAAPTARFSRISVAVFKVLRVRIIPSAISPHIAVIFGNNPAR